MNEGHSQDRDASAGRIRDAGLPGSDLDYPVFGRALPAGPIAQGRFEVRFARTCTELEAIQRLRFEVFNLELGEGLDESFASGLDRDRFDPVTHHLLVTETASSSVVGTYRMQTGEMARCFGGFYSADEFDLQGLPPEVLDHAVEIGRACVARPFRNRQVLFLLWKGLAAYLTHNRKRFLFGCCSLTSQDPVEGRRVMEHLLREGRVHRRLRVRPQPAWACYPDGFELPSEAVADVVQLPRLFRLYLRYGAKVLGPPALDRQFKTIDYLVLLDVAELDAESRATFFG